MNTQIAYRCLQATNNVYAIEVDLTLVAVTDNDALRTVLQKIYSALQQSFPHRAIQIRSLLVPAHNVTGTLIMDLNDTHPLKPITQQLRLLDFSRTACSGNSLLSLSELPNLVEARFDGCKELELQITPKPCAVQRLSLLDTKIHASCMKGMLTTFPNLRTLRVTLDPTMHQPLGFVNWDAHNLPSSHFTLMGKKQMFMFKKIDVEFYKEENVWKVKPVDALFTQFTLDTHVDLVQGVRHVNQ